MMENIWRLVINRKSGRVSDFFRKHIYAILPYLYEPFISRDETRTSEHLKLNSLFLLAD